MHIRKISLLLVLLQLATLAASCSGENPDSPESGQEPITSSADSDETTSPLETSGVPRDLNLNGETINIWYTTSPYSTVETFPDLAGELTGETLDDTTYNTNRAVEDRLNCTLNFYDSLCKSSETGDEAQKIIMAGDDTYDMFHVVQWNGTRLATEGYFMNMSGAPYISLDKPWWDEYFMKEMAVGKNKYYMLVGDYCIDRTRNLSCMFYNKTLYEKYYKDPDGLYNDVIDGTWTWDKLRKIASDSWIDINNNGNVDRGDQYGYSINGGNYLDGLFYGTGARVTGRDEKNYPTLILNNERVADISAGLYNLVYETTGGFDGGSTFEDYTLNQSDFASDMSMFLFGFFYTAESLRDMKNDFGIIPYPKFDEDQENYVSIAHDITRMMGIPVGCGKYDAVCAVLEELSFEGYNSVVPAYYDVLMKNKYSRDDVSAEMLDIIRDNCRPDIAYIYLYSFNQLGLYFRYMIQDKSSNFASLYAGYEAGAKVNMQSLIDQFESID